MTFSTFVCHILTEHMTTKCTQCFTVLYYALLYCNALYCSVLHYFIDYSSRITYSTPPLSFVLFLSPSYSTQLIFSPLFVFYQPFSLLLLPLLFFSQEVPARLWTSTMRRTRETTQFIKQNKILIK